MSERVLVFPESTLFDIGKFQGFQEYGKLYLDKIFENNNIKFIERDLVENDPSYKQLIPYIVISCDEGIFIYQRSKKGGETRLHGKWSLGISGHINDRDLASSTDIEHPGLATYVEGMYRELEEELDISSGFYEELLGAIYDDNNDVGKVHFGIVHRFYLNEPNIKIKDEGICDAAFININHLIEYKDSFESWSQYLIQYLYSNKEK